MASQALSIWKNGLNKQGSYTVRNISSHVERHMFGRALHLQVIFLSMYSISLNLCSTFYTYGTLCRQVSVSTVYVHLWSLVPFPV